MIDFNYYGEGAKNVTFNFFHRLLSILMLSQELMLRVKLQNGTKKNYTDTVVLVLTVGLATRCSTRTYIQNAMNKLVW